MISILLPHELAHTSHILFLGYTLYTALDIDTSSLRNNMASYTYHCLSIVILQYIVTPISRLTNMVTKCTWIPVPTWHRQIPSFSITCPPPTEFQLYLTIKQLAQITTGTHAHKKKEYVKTKSIAHGRKDFIVYNWITFHNSENKRNSRKDN